MARTTKWLLSLVIWKRELDNSMYRLPQVRTGTQDNYDPEFIQAVRMRLTIVRMISKSVIWSVGCMSNLNFYFFILCVEHQGHISYSTMRFSYNPRQERLSGRWQW